MPVAAGAETPPAPVELKVLYSEMPEIPKRAMRQGIANGSVVATIAKWRFAPIPEDRRAVELVFKP